MPDTRRVGFFSVIGDLNAVGVTPPVTPPTPPPATDFNTGTRRLHVSATSTAPLDGSTPDLSFTTIQAALDVAASGDVITVGAGTYNERPTLTNFAGALNFGLWLVAEERGEVIIQDMVTSLANGANNWVNEGGGVYSNTYPSSNSYLATFNNVFLPRYNNETQLRASQVTFDNVARNRPIEGHAIEGGRIYIRLPNNQNPNNQEILVTQTEGRALFDLNNADNVIIDGFRMRGSGTSACIEPDTACANLMVRNCVFTHSRFGVRCADNTIIEDCEYLYPGVDDWWFALQSLNGVGVSNEVGFEYVKQYTGAAGNAIYEGGINVGRSGAPPTGCTLRRNKVGPCFDGMRLGELDTSVAHDNFFFRCFDDGVQTEGFRVTDTAENVTLRENLFVDCFVPISIQDANVNGPQFIYRNVVINETENNIQVYAILKTIHTPPNAANVYNNTFIHRGSGNISGFGTNKWVWADFSTHEGDCVERLFNNIFIFEDRLTQDSGGGPNPGTIRNNILVAPSSSSLVQGTNGVFAGTTEADAGVNISTDFTLTSSSPARGAGVTRTSQGMPDAVSTSDLDCGAFIFGTTPTGPDPGEAWPRSRDTIFRTTTPERWVP